MSRDSQTETNSRVAVIGGGPAGSFFALFLLHYARQTGKRYEVTIYQERDFNGLGPKGCKGCAGVLDMSVVENLKELDLTIPEEIIQSKIVHYAVHSPYTSISISNPGKGVKILSVTGVAGRVSPTSSTISVSMAGCCPRLKSEALRWRTRGHRASTSNRRQKWRWPARSWITI